MDATRHLAWEMPVRSIASCPQPLTEIFEMNLREGALRERLQLAFAKATGSVDELDLLAITGRTLLGRVHFTAVEAELDEEPIAGMRLRAGGSGDPAERWTLLRQPIRVMRSLSAENRAPAG